MAAHTPGTPTRLAAGWRPWLAAAAVVTVAAATSLSSFYLPHYVAPAMPPLLILFAVGCGVLNRLSIGGRPAGRSATVTLLAGLGLFGVWQLAAQVPDEWELANDRQWSRRREALERHLRTLPGAHLVFVHYGPSYRSQDEWVQNSADRTGTRVLWAHDMGETENTHLRALEPRRTTWRLVVEAGNVAPPMIAPYDSAQHALPIPPDRARGQLATPPY